MIKTRESAYYTKNIQLCRSCGSLSRDHINLVPGKHPWEGDLPHWRIECLCGVCSTWCRSPTTAVAQWDELQTAKKLVNAAFRDGLEIGVINLKPDHYGAHK